MNVLIIEDEKLLQEELIKQLNVYKDIQVVKCIQTVKESIDWLSQNTGNIDLIFMDIELADGISFEIFESIELTTPTIFLTAYSEYAIRAFKVNSIDYLLKPINPDELSAALIKFKTYHGAFNQFPEAFFKDFYKKTGVKYSNRLLIQYGDNYKYIESKDIAYFISEDKYTTVVTFEDNRYLINESLSQLEEILNGNKFFRPTRNVIINIEAIVKATKYFKSRLKLIITPSPDSDIIVSRVKVDKFLKWMGRNETE